MWKAAGYRLCGLGLSISLASTACVTHGRNFSSDLSWLKKEQTTQADVQRNLGAPEAIGNSGGTATWIYRYNNYRLIGESATKELKIYWTPAFKVADYSFNSSWPEDRRRSLEGQR